MQREQGAERVADAIACGAVISTVNLGEALSTLALRGQDPQQTVDRFTAAGLLNGAIRVEPVVEADAIEAARLRPLTKSSGLSMADRVCLALAKRLNVPALTTDGGWHTLDVGVEIVHIRDARP
jgi:PIN domain nuclease of toxin-antitoxin system